jgi:predicted nucleic acid-binding protein
VALILDTSVLLAALDANDPAYQPCAGLITDASEDLIVPSLVLSELDYWCHERLTPPVWLAFLDDVLAGAYTTENPTHADLRRCRELQSTYADLRLGVVDASVMALAERLGESKVGTLDHRHFGTIRPRHVTALELLPVP